MAHGRGGSTRRAVQRETRSPVPRARFRQLRYAVPRRWLRSHVRSCPIPAEDTGAKKPGIEQSESWLPAALA